jgi:hypothetical protein
VEHLSCGRHASRRDEPYEPFQAAARRLFVVSVGIAAPSALAHAPAHAVKTHSLRVAQFASWADSASWAD